MCAAIECAKVTTHEHANIRWRQLQADEAYWYYAMGPQGFSHLHAELCGGLLPVKVWRAAVRGSVAGVGA